MDLYLTTAHCRTNLCPIMEELPLESSALGIDSLVLSLKSSMLIQDVRPMPKLYQHNKRLRIETSSSKSSLSSMIDALVESLESDLLLHEALSKSRRKSKKRYNRWSSDSDTSKPRRVQGEVKATKDVSPKRPCRY